MTRTPDRISLQEAAALSGLSYSEVYRRVSGCLCPAQQSEDGAWTMSCADAEQLKRRAPSTDPREAYQVRADRRRTARWQAAAAPVPVSTWLAELADLACSGERLELLTRAEVRRWQELAEADGVGPLEWLRGKLRQG
jgi:hypothetical protein